MTPQEFQKLWTPTDDDTLEPLSHHRLTGFKLQPSTIDFLTISGLPGTAAPFLSFVSDTDDTYDGISTLTDQYDFIEPGFDHYVVIGSDGAGNPIVINTNNNDRIEWLDHENNFSPRFFNTDIGALAGCLIAYQDFIKRIQAENGEDAFLNSDFTDEQFAALQQRIASEDPSSTNTEGFWKEQLEMDLASREEFRSNK